MDQIDTFNKQLHGGSVRKAMDSNNAGRLDLWLLKPSALLPIEGFNVRVKDAEYHAHIRSLANSMKTEGYLREHPVAGYVAKEGDDQVVYYYDGHCRLAAVELANSEGAEIEQVPVTVNQSGMSMEDMIVVLARGNSGKRLSVYETALVCKRLIRYGLPEEKIAERLDITLQYVKNLLSLMSAPVELRQMVMDSKVSATVAIDIIAQHGEHATEKLQEAETRATSAGKTRITAKHTKTAADALTRKPELIALLMRVQDDKWYNKLEEDLRKDIDKLFRAMKAAQKSKSKQLED